MAHTVVGKLNKAANEIPTQNGTGFGVRIGRHVYNRQTKQKEWTNFSAVIFASAPQQVDFYRSALVPGAVIEVSGDDLRIDEYQGQSGTTLSLEIQNAKLGYVYAPNQQQGGYQQQPQQGYSQPVQQPQQAYQQPQQPQYSTPPPSQQPQYQAQPQGAPQGNFHNPPPHQ